MGKRFTLFTLCMALFVMFSTNVFASSKYYSKAVVQAVGQGTVYVNTANKDTGAEYSESSEASQSSTSKDHNYYIFAKPATGFKLEGWFTDETCETAASAEKQDNGIYRVTISATSQTEAKPTTMTYYAKFIEATEYYSSKVTVTSVGNGNVAVSTEPEPQDFGAEKTASCINTVEPGHTYYLNANVDDVAAYRFVGWYDSEECANLLSDKASYTYKVTAESTDDQNPTQFRVYAKFEAIPYYYSSVKATAVGSGQVYVNTQNSSSEAEWTTESNADQKIADNANHTYYLFAQVENEDDEFDGWFANEECTELLASTLNYTYKVTSESLDPNDVSKFNVYAKFTARNYYQIRNSGFEKWAANNEPGFGWNSFPSAVGAQASLGKGLSPNPERVEGRGAEGNAVRIYSKFAGLFGFGANANGNLTTGIVNMGSTTPDDPKNHNYTDVEDPNHCMVIVGQPDSVEFYTKYKMGDGNPHTGHASFIIHDEINYIDPEREEQAAHRIGFSGVNIEVSEDWVRNVGTFDYDWTVDNAAATKKYILVDFTTNITPGGSKDDELIIDDVRLIYNSELASAKYNGEDLTFVDGVATVDAVLRADDAIELESNGRCAKIEQSFNSETNELTIIVKGQDFEVNPENVHSYTVKFAGCDGEYIVAAATMAVKKGFGYGTFCAPFEFSVPEDVTASIATINADGKTLALESVGETIPANTPVVLTSENVVSVTKYGKFVANTPVAGALTGVYTATPAPVGSYVLQNHDGKLGFYKVVEGKQPTVGANRAYLTSSSAAEAFFFDSETAIETIEALTTGEAAIYDLNGVKQQSLQKGINIVKLANGKTQKVLVK